MKAFADQLEDSEDFSATLELIDEDVIQTRLAEAEAMELPSLDHIIKMTRGRTLVTRSLAVSNGH